MKNLLHPCLFLAFATLAMGDGIPTVTVSGQTFPFSFVDATLSDQERMRIAADVAALWEDQPGSVVQQGAEGSGRLFLDTMWASPCANNVEPPSQLVSEGTNLCLRVGNDVSSAYRVAFQFADAHTNEVTALAAIIDALSATSLSNATPASLSAMLFGETVETTEERDRIVGELLETHFCRPSLLGLHLSSDSFAIVPPGTLLALIPCHDLATAHWDRWGAALLDGHWQLIPPMP